MAQQHWNYQDDHKHPYQLSIYHGDQSGHVIIYSQKEILFLDFSVKIDKVYNFYLGADLMTLSITTKNKSLVYTLKSDKDQKTIQALETGNYPKRHLYKALGLISIILLVIVIIVILMTKK